MSGDWAEYVRLLKRLTPDDRVAWLQWCCQQVSKGVMQTRITETKGGVNEVFWDAISLKTIHGLDMERAGKRLVQMVYQKRGG